jgi:hypothetical protein
MNPKEEKRIKQLIETKGRLDELIDEIGSPLIKQAFELHDLELKATRLQRELELLQGVKVDRPPLEPEWFALLERLNEGDPMVLLPYLKVPERVLSHIEDVLRNRKLKRQGRKRPPIPSYMDASRKEVSASVSAELVRHLVEKGVSKEKAVELMSLISGLPKSKISAVMGGDSSAVRNLRARRARRAAR